MSYYPAWIYPGTARVEDNVDIVMAENVNDLRREVQAIEETLGQNPQEASVAGNSYTTVKQRLDVLERALLRNYDDRYVALAGGSMIRRTNANSGLGIASPETEITPAVEVLRPGNSLSTGNVTTRSSVRIWGTGIVESGNLTINGQSGRLAFHTGTGVIDADGTLSIQSTGTTTITVDNREQVVVRPFSTDITGAITTHRHQTYHFPDYEGYNYYVPASVVPGTDPISRPITQTLLGNPSSFQFTAPASGVIKVTITGLLSNCAIGYKIAGPRRTVATSWARAIMVAPNDLMSSVTNVAIIGGFAKEADLDSNLTYTFTLLGAGLSGIGAAKHLKVMIEPVFDSRSWSGPIMAQPIAPV